ncbi:hypothetical protein [Geopseudomonas aromaticivorans]
MAGAAQLIARLNARAVPSVPSLKNMREPLEAAPAVAVPPVPSVPSRNHQGQGENQPATLAPAAEPTSEPQRNAWTITRGGRPICNMVGAPMTYDEALAEARWRWPDADILEN